MELRPEYLPFGRPNFSEAEIDAVARVMRSGWIGQGKETAAFEQELGAFVNARQVISVSSCTAGLFLSLAVLRVGRGDEVIVPSFTWCSTANAALYLGATPVFCDIDPKTFCITPESVRAKLSKRTKAVIVVHMGGLAADLQQLKGVLPEGVAIVEDAAHALGALDPLGRPIGSSGNLVNFSFYANKNLSTAEGGAIVLQDAECAEELRSLRLHGLPADAWMRFTNPNVLSSPSISRLGYKMNYTDLQSAIGRVQLSRFAELQDRRMDIACRYMERLEGIEGIGFQTGLDSPAHARHLFLVVLPRAEANRSNLTRDEIVLGMRKANVGATVHYHPLHDMPLYADYRQGNLANTEELAARVLTLPISASMSVEDADYVSRHLRRLLEE